MTRSSLPLFSAALLLAFASGCSNSGEAPPDGPVGRMIAASAGRNHVPADLMVAIAHVEGGLRLSMVREVHEDDAVPVAGVLELRRGRFNSLARGASLMGLQEA